MQARGVAFQKPARLRTTIDGTLPVNDMAILQLYQISQRNPVVVSILDFLQNWMTSSPWTVEIRHKADSSMPVFSDDNRNMAFAKQIQVCLPQMIRDAYIYGFTVLQYTIKDSITRKADATGLDKLVRVMNVMEYQLREVITKRGNREWLAFERGNNIDKARQQESLPNTRVFIFTGAEPEPLTLMPMSHAQRALRPILAYDEQMALAQAVSYRRAAPLTVYTADVTKQIYPADRTNWQAFSNAAGSAHFGNTSRFSETPEGSTQQMPDVILNPEMRNELSARQSMAAILQSVHERAEQRSLFKMPNMDGSNEDYAIRFAEFLRRYPDQPSKLLAPGTDIASNTPESKSPEHFIEIEAELRRQIATCFGVPPEYVGSVASRVTAAIVSGRKILEVKTTTVHKWLSDCISQLFLDLHYDDVAEAIGLSIDDILAGTNPDGAKRPQGLRNGLLMRDKYKDFIDRQLIINVHFTESAAASEETLIKMLQLKVIDHDTFGRFWLASNGISEAVQRKLSKKEQEEVIDILNGQLMEEPASSTDASGKRKESRANDGKLSSKRQKITAEKELQNIESRETRRTQNAESANK